MDRLPMLDGPGQLRNMFINERNRLRQESPAINTLLMRFIATLPPESFESDPRLFAQYGAGFGYFERDNRGDISASGDFMPDTSRHALNAFMAIQPRKSLVHRHDEELLRAVKASFHHTDLQLGPTVDQADVDHAVAFVGGYRIVNEF